MTIFFPEPYDDEILYSIIARYHYYASNSEVRDTLKELFNSRNIIPTIELCCNIRDLCNRIGNSMYDEDFFINRHTNIPIYYPFIKKNQQSNVLNYMKNSGGKGIYAKLGLLAGNICSKTELYYCPECVNEDIRNFGEPYFHRIHQIPGVYICPIHLCYIKKYCLNRKDVGRVSLIKLDEKRINLHVSYMKNDEVNVELLKVAKAFEYLLTTDLEEYNQENVMKKYKIVLERNGLITPKGRVKQKKLKQVIFNHYSKEVLEILHSSINNKQTNWLYKMGRKTTTFIQPLRHILFILCFYNNLREFFTVNEESIFCKKKWPCLNPVADHYKELTIDDCKITSDYRTRMLVGTFKCEKCGFIYSRKIDNDNIFKIGRVKDYGYVWKNRLRNLIDSNEYSINRLASLMQCDPKTIKKYSNNLKNKVDDYNKKKVFDNNLKKYWEQYSKDILRYKKEHPKSTRNQLRKYLKKQYSWFYRNDRKWLINNLPVQSKTNKTITTQRVDWGKRDDTICAKLEETYINLIRGNARIRITKSLLGCRLGISAMIYYNLNKLPKTEHYLKHVVESVEKFQIRRVKTICRRMINANEDIKKWKVIRRAGLNKDCSQVVVEKINYYINLQNKNNKFI